jgi:hypothetical protein
MKYIVIDKDDTSHRYIVPELYTLISKIYEQHMEFGKTFKQVSEWFYEDHIVFAIEGHVHQIKVINK